MRTNRIFFSIFILMFSFDGSAITFCSEVLNPVFPYGSLSQLKASYDPNSKSTMTPDPAQYEYLRSIESSAGRSMVCGPVCLINVLHKARIALGKTSRFKNLMQELDHMIQANFKKLYADNNLLENGIIPEDLKDLAHEHFEEQGINLRTKLYGLDIEYTPVPKKFISADILKEDMYLHDNRSIILKLEQHNVVLHQTPSNKTFDGAHFVVLVATRTISENKMEVTFLDPSNPTVPETVLLTEYEFVKDDYRGFEVSLIGANRLRSINYKLFPARNGNKPDHQRTFVTSMLVLEY